MKVFPAWAAHLGLKDAVIKGIDFPLHADAVSYRQAVEFIKHDPLSLGALVTTHKIDLFQACKDMFDVIDPHAATMGETSCISKPKITRNHCPKTCQHQNVGKYATNCRLYFCC